MQSETKTTNPQVAWHAREIRTALATLKVDPDRGLAEEETKTRRQAYGPNALPQGKKTTALQMFLRQFTSPLVYILLIAAVLTAVIREYADMSVILIVVVVNALIGLFQEYRASKIFEKLKSIVRVEALVIREGKLRTADSADLVPGDIIVLKGGNKVPADARIISCANLEADEALLTGESKPVKKAPAAKTEKTLLAERTDMVFMGTVLEGGEGLAVVVATGGRTEIGRISLLAQGTQSEESPLAGRMKKLAKVLTEIFVAISVVIFLVGLAVGDSLIEMIKTTIAIAVAAIPEGLPAAISIVLAVSSKKILEKKGLVMRLVAAETLGSTTVICTDKTGTLTYGQMKVEEILALDQDAARLAMALANEAVVEETDGKKRVRGEATDKAKLESFLAGGGDLAHSLKSIPRAAILSFNPISKYLASFHKTREGIKIFVSGAPEVIIGKSELAAAKKQELQQTFEGYARRGFRMIALAHRNVEMSKFPKDGGPENLEKFITNLTYLGMAAIRDGVRQDVRATLEVTRKAGIKVIMITGDHLLTARAIGLELGFKISGGAVVSGQELDQWNDKELAKRVGEIEIISRAEPVHKMRVIAAWQNLGAVVAMTGDGVNDAPALKSADIGVAIGSGTDVAKEASDLILLNDSFSTITAAVEEGRTAFANIRKATVAVMSNAFTEIILITSTLILNTPFPITAIQILWVNIVEDGLPILAMAFEPAEKEIMNSRPTSPKEPILDKESKLLIFFVSIFADLTLVGIFLFLLKDLRWDLVKIQSLIFVATATPTLVNVFSYKSLRTPIWRIRILNNRFLLMAVAVGYLLMIAAIYVPFFNRFLKTVPLPLWPALTALLLFPLYKMFFVELTKWRFKD